MQSRINSPVDAVKERLSITDVISSYLELIPSGINFKAKCPFHNEKTPSFFVSSVRNAYYCFGCGAKGDIFSFVENFEGVDFKGALRTLAERAGVPLVYSKEETDKKERLYMAMESACVFFEQEYSKEPEVYAYLVSRGLTDETIKSFRVGYAPDAWRNLSDYLRKQGFTDQELEEVGLIKVSDKSNFNEKKSYDRFRNRIMFPIFDSSSRVIAFSGRLFELRHKNDDPDFTEAKYLNSPDTILFNKSNVLFGIDKAKSAIRKRDYTIIVEGQIDLLLSHQMGCTNTVAVSGTALSSTIKGEGEDSINNLGLIRRLSKNIIFAYDGDSAGERATGRSALIALSLDMQVKVAVLPTGKDPAEVIRENPNNWKEILRNSVHIINFFINKVCTNFKDERERGRKIREIVFPYIRVLQSAIDQAYYLRETARKANISETAIIADFEKFKIDIPIATQIVKEVELKSGKSRKEMIEAKFFGILFEVEAQNITSEAITKYLEEFIELIGQDVFDNLKSTNEIAKDTLAMEAQMWYGKEINEMENDFKELSLNLAEEILQQKSNSILEEYRNFENDNYKSKEILEEYQKVVQKIHHIKNRRLE